MTFVDYSDRISNLAEFPHDIRKDILIDYTASSNTSDEDLVYFHRSTYSGAFLEDGLGSSSFVASCFTFHSEGKVPAGEQYQVKKRISRHVCEICLLWLFRTQS